MRHYIISLSRRDFLSITASNEAQAIRVAKRMGWIQEDTIFVIEEVV